MRNAIDAISTFTRTYGVVWLPAAGSVVYLVLWIVAEAGRWNLLDKTVVFVLFAAAIGLAGWKPLVSLGIVIGVPVLQLLGVLYPPSALTWPMYLAVPLVALVVGFGASGWARRLALPVLVISAVLIPVRMMVQSDQEGFWTSWTGGQMRNFPRFDPAHPIREDLIVLVALALITVVAFWAIGVAARSLLSERRMGGVLVSATSQLKEADFELRLSQDRARISRDVHDALAHSLAVIVSQAEGALALQSKKPQVAGEALRNIATVGRTALVDVRSLVESIHDDDLAGAKPVITDLAGLVADLKDIGMDATLRVLGEPVPLSSTHEMAVFRIVQESLTNGLKHAGPKSTVRATLDWQGVGLAILVVSRGTVLLDEELAGESRGVGVQGMKERARLAGGWLTAQPSGDGSFIVTAFIPTHGATTDSIDTRALADA